jgi:6-phosphofructokinase 1
VCVVIISPYYSRVVGYVRAGAREKIFFEPSTVKAAVVTCGGLCPGMNSVIREICCSLYRLYGASEVWGVRYGYEGFYSTANPPVRLTPEVTKNCHSLGGTILGSSRGGFDLQKIVGGILRHGFNQVFIIGGDGTHRGAQAIFQEVRRRRLKVAVVGVPKTIDNDLSLIDRSFGFDTAVVEAEKALRAAAVEAECAVNGVCIVQLMGRNAGFVAAHAALASRQVDVCLVPEVPFDKDQLLAYIKQLLLKQESCVICQAEAAGLEYCVATGEKDKSGNPRLPDVSQWLKSELTAALKAEGVFREINCRIINPRYLSRMIVYNNVTFALLCQLHDPLRAAQH